MMFDFCRHILFIGVAFVVIGCADNSERMDLRVGLFFTEDTRTQIVPFEPLHYPVMDKTDDFRAGKYIVSTFTKVTRRVFSHVEVLDSHPTQASIADRQLNLVVIARVIHEGGSLGYHGNGFENSSEASTSLATELDCFNHEMTEVTFVSASVVGRASAQTILLDAKRKAFVDSVKDAIHNLGDEMALQLSFNSEIRKMAD